MYEIATLFKLTEKIHNYISSHFSQVYEFFRYKSIQIHIFMKKTGAYWEPKLET